MVLHLLGQLWDESEMGARSDVTTGLWKYFRGDVLTVDHAWREHQTPPEQSLKAELVRSGECSRLLCASRAPPDRHDSPASDGDTPRRAERQPLTLPGRKVLVRNRRHPLGRLLQSLRYHALQSPSRRACPEIYLLCARAEQGHPSLPS